MAVLRRGGMRPQAYVSPADMRATRDLLRRRRYLPRKRAARLAHSQNPNSPSNLPESGQKLAYNAHRAGVAERCADAAVHKRLEGDLALLEGDDPRLSALEGHRVTAAKPHHANTVSLLQPVPGLGKILRLVLLSALHDLQRFPRVQDVVSYGRLVTCAHESAGQRYGTAGTKSGHADLPWAFSDAAVLFLRDTAAGQTYLTRGANTHGQGQALTLLAQPLGRAV